MSQVLPIFKGFCDINPDAHLLGTPWLRARAVTFFRAITSIEGLGKIGSVDASSMLMSLLELQWVARHPEIRGSCCLSS